MAGITLIGQARAERGLTQEQLANLAGISRAAVRDMEYARRSPYLTTLAKVCRVLELDLNLAYADLNAHVNGERESA